MFICSHNAISPSFFFCGLKDPVTRSAKLYDKFIYRFICGGPAPLFHHRKTRKINNPREPEGCSGSTAPESAPLRAQKRFWDHERPPKSLFRGVAQLRVARELRPLASVGERHEVPRPGPDVVRPRPDEPIVFALLDEVGRPPCDAAGDKQRRVEFYGQPHVVVEAGTRPIEVRRQTFLAADMRSIVSAISSSSVDRSLRPVAGNTRAG